MQKRAKTAARRGGRRALFAAFGLGYLQEAEDARDAPTLFDLMEEAK